MNRQISQLSETEYAIWKEKLDKLQSGGLETNQSAGTGWSTMLGAVLGVFGTVAFVGGLPTLDKLAEPWRQIAKIATLVAFVLLLLATIYANLAARSMTARRLTITTPDELKSSSELAAKASAEDLRWAKRFGTLAALLILGSTVALFWIGEAPKPSEPPTLLVSANGTSACGKLESSNGGLVVDELPLTDLTDALVVTKCP
jgi:hypothetical protein